MDNKNGDGSFLVNSFGDRYLYEVNGSAFDKVGSEISFSKHFGKEIFAENSLYVISGSDSGLLPQYLVKQGLPEGSYYIFIEIPGVLARLKSLIPKQGFHKKIIMTTEEEWLSRAKEIEFQNFVYLGNLKFLLSFAAADGRYSEYLELSTHLQEELEKIRWGLNAELGAELFHQRQMENLSANRLSAVHLHGTFNGKTAIVLAGGPSLDAALPWVIKNRHCFVVIAVSRIARRLLEVDISPDIIVSVDPNQISFDISKEMLNLWERTVFVNKYHVVSTLLGQWCGRSLFLGPRVPWESFLNEDTTDSPGPTVTNSAIDLAIKMGFAQVLLAGVDLCYSRDGYTHAQGSNEQQTGPQLGGGLLWVETNGGEMAETTPDLHFAATQIGAQAALAGQQDCRVVNLSEGATKIGDVGYSSCAEIELEALPKTSFQMIRESLPPDTTDDRISYYQVALTELIKAQKTFREIKRLSKEALRANESFFGRRGSGKGNHKHKAKMDRIEKKLKNNFSDFANLVKKFGIRGFLKLTQGDQDRDWNRDDVERLGQVYYEAYRDSSGRLLDMVDTATERLRSRLEEEQEQPDFLKLFEQWKKDSQPGRSIVWKNNHLQHNVPDECVAQFMVLEREFDEVMLLQETAHLKQTRSLSQLGRVRGKLMVMYKQHQIENLRHLVNNLNLLDDNVEATSLAYLGKGYLAELEGDPDRALAEYQDLLDTQEGEQNLSILEDALRRLLSLSLQHQDYTNAQVVAECLAGISVTYLPYYADLLWLLDEKRTALDAYADYLEKVPNDHAVMIKLGRYYLELGLLDGAQMMFEAVIERDSSNIAARTLLGEMTKA